MGNYMVKLTNLFKQNIKLFIGIIIGGILFGGSAYVLASVIASSSVTYTGNGQTTVEGALTDLYQKADSIVPIDPNTFDTNSDKNVYASSKGVCIKRNNKLNCFIPNNYDSEVEHLQQVFSGEDCHESYYRGTFLGIACYAADLNCSILVDGRVNCQDQSNYSYCDVFSDGSVSCN